MIRNAGASARKWWTRSVAGLVIFIILVGVGLILLLRPPNSNNGGSVPWINTSASSVLLNSLKPRSLPPVPPETSAAPCLARNLSVSSVHPVGATQNDGVMVTFRNAGSSSCLLRGTPQVDASEKGQRTVGAAREALPNYGEVANTAPGATVDVEVDVPATCRADPGGSNKGWATYHDLTVTFPSGSTKSISGVNLSFPCGMFTTPFFTVKPPLRYPPYYLGALAPHLVLPESVRAGSTLTYEVDLVNLSKRSVALTPCPAYLEHSAAPTKFEYALNCRGVHAISAHGQVRYQMKMVIPLNSPHGRLEVWWELVGPSDRSGRGYVQLK